MELSIHKHIRFRNTVGAKTYAQKSKPWQKDSSTQKTTDVFHACLQKNSQKFILDMNTDIFLPQQVPFFAYVSSCFLLCRCRVLGKIPSLHLFWVPRYNGLLFSTSSLFVISCWFFSCFCHLLASMCINLHCERSSFRFSTAN